MVPKLLHRVRRVGGARLAANASWGVVPAVEEPFGVAGPGELRELDVRESFREGFARSKGSFIFGTTTSTTAAATSNSENPDRPPVGAPRRERRGQIHTVVRDRVLLEGHDAVCAEHVGIEDDGRRPVERRPRIKNRLVFQTGIPSIEITPTGLERNAPLLVVVGRGHRRLQRRAERQRVEHDRGEVVLGGDKLFRCGGLRVLHPAIRVFGDPISEYLCVFGASWFGVRGPGRQNDSSDGGAHADGRRRRGARGREGEEGEEEAGGGEEEKKDCGGGATATARERRCHFEELFFFIFQCFSF